MKLFTVGPTQMKKEIMEVGGQQIPYFRTVEFSENMLDSDRLLQKFMNAPEGAKSIYLTASGTAAMEAVVMNCLTPDDNVLIVDGGTFGHRFTKLCDIHGIPYQSIVLSDTEQLTADHLSQFNDVEITALLVNINETSTGQLYDVKLLGDFCKRKNAYFIVDAISSYLIDEYDMASNGIDATIISSQKGLCIAPGMSVAVLSKKLVDERIAGGYVKSLYFDFNEYIKNFQRGQTPFTPCVGICLEMNKALHMIEDIGLEQYLKSIDCVAKDFRSKVKKLPVRIPDFPLGNAVTPIIFEQPIAKQVFEILKNKYDVFLNPTGGKTEDYVLRVAHIGDTSMEDNSVLIELLQRVIKSIER